MRRYAGAARFAYNWGLNRWQEMRSMGEKPSWQVLNADLNARKATEFPWLTGVPWRVANGALEDLGSAFTNFFRRCKQGERRKGYPRFKSRKRSHTGFCIEGRAAKFVGKTVRLPKIGSLRLSEPLRFPGKVLSVRVTERAGHWYISAQIDVDETKWTYRNRCENQAATVGVDLGVVDLVVLSNGERVAAPRPLHAKEDALRKLNKEMARRKKGGANWLKTKARLGRLHEKIANVRRDVAHKFTASLVRRFGVIGVESLNVSGMMQGRLSKSVNDAAMVEILRQVQYKASLAGCIVVEADRWFPSSKTCSVCGMVYRELSLNERTWTCAGCGTEHDRDVNAAQNLKKLAEARSATACRHESAGSVRKNGTKLSLGQEFSSLAVK
jgi:putative transposase